MRSDGEGYDLFPLWIELGRDAVWPGLADFSQVLPLQLMLTRNDESFSIEEGSGKHLFDKRNF